MKVIDADAHVIESEATWDYLTRAERELVESATLEGPDGSVRYGWKIDGRFQTAGSSSNDLAEVSMTSEIRKLTDVEGRLRMMDDLGIDVQVIYPSLFLYNVSEDPAAEAALSRSYNRFVADQIAKSDGRMYSVVVAPFMNVDAAIEEIRYGADHGAKAVLWRGMEHGMFPDDPYFAPVLDVMNDLGLPLCSHAGNGTRALKELNPRITPFSSIFPQKIPGIMAFHNVMGSDLSSRYPNIKFGFIELTAAWVPYVLQDVVLRVLSPGGWQPHREKDQFKSADIAALMEERHVFVAAQTIDDLPYILQYSGPNTIVAGTDFGHADTSSELRALDRIHETPGVDSQILDNILDANPRALYGV
jgi:uncharacterized protein